LGLLATLAARGLLSVGGSSVTAVDWALYDLWVRRHPPAPAPSEILVVVRDAQSEARLGTGAWDRALLARVIGALSRAGAGAIGIDVPLDRPSTPGRGGAASDALLGEATALAGNVVFPVAVEAGRDGAPASSTLTHRSWPPLPSGEEFWPVARPTTGALPGFAQRARALGHLIAPEEPDGVVRTVPLFARVGDHLVPAFGLALAMVFTNLSPDALGVDRAGVQIPVGSIARVPVDGRGRAALTFAAPVHVVSFLEIWRAVEDGQADTLPGLVDGKIVLLVTEPGHAHVMTPVGPMSDILVQAHLLGAVLGGSWLQALPFRFILAGALVIAVISAWLWLAFRWWKALLGALALAGACALALALSPSVGLLVPVWLPLASMTLASALALSWNLLASSGQMRHLETEIALTRDTLVRRESAVEALEEDLDAARAAAARSTGAEETLRAELAAARKGEEQTRARLLELERQVKVWRPTPDQSAPPGDPGHDRQRRECLRLGIITRDPGVLAIFGDLEKAARSTLPILIEGEPGTGKELFARAVHRLSPRADGPFVAVNMAAIPAELFESELFGHVRGSFTGAVVDRKGHFEQADRGTLFLDEVGELRPEHQGKLLRVLQEKSFYRVGATRPVAVDVRVVAATNRDLQRGVRDGWFREDLYFRLKGFVLGLPPLRERREDLSLLAERFTEDAAAETGRSGIALSEAALLAIEKHDWPGNVRELQHCLRQAVALCPGTLIGVEDLRLPRREMSSNAADEDVAVLDSLRRHGFDMQATARALGLDRSTVTQRLKGLGFRALAESGGDRGKAALALAGGPALAGSVDLKLREYHAHLLRAIREYATADAAVSACRRRFKNLPERHFRSLETLVRQHFDRGPSRA
jgi:transcriptional regulator with GAF, ATPase, and Fis domain/CHASE2 domain-containing sensor protein